MYPVSVLDNRANPTGQSDALANKRFSINQTSKKRPTFFHLGGEEEKVGLKKVSPSKGLNE